MKPKTVALHGRQFDATAKPYISSLLQALQHQQVEVVCSEDYSALLKSGGIEHPYTATYSAKNPLTEPVDFIFSLGGDGTLLDTVTHVGEHQTPIVGINMGRLGFLATTPPEQITEIIAPLLNNDFDIDERTLLSINREVPLFKGLMFGLNDFVVTKTERSSMIVVHTHINGEFMNTYWADGVVFSTPTGSTGYCLSVGGPILMPHSQTFVIAPISPHNLSMRPMVVEDSSVITLEVESRSKSFLVSLDSRSEVVREEHQHLSITVKKEAFKARLVRFRESKFLDTLRHKLNWGLDYRNKNW